jgi:hypothetical protein
MKWWFVGRLSLLAFDGALPHVEVRDVVKSLDELSFSCVVKVENQTTTYHSPMHSQTR